MKSKFKHDWYEQLLVQKWNYYEATSSCCPPWHITWFTDDFDPGQLLRRKYTLLKGHLRVQCDTRPKVRSVHQRSTGTFLRSFIWFLSLAEQNESIHEDQEEQRAGNRNNYTPHPLFYGEAVKCLCKWEEEVDGFSLQVIFSKNV